MELFKLFAAYMGPTVLLVNIVAAIWLRDNVDVNKTTLMATGFGLCLWLTHVGFIY